jgi:N-sulfoglucosamine sulfohydrolase
MTSHDLGRHLHCYGKKSVVSPNLDSFAAEGIKFEMAFATAPQCSPSRASIASGRYPHNNGVMGLAHHGFDWELSPSSPHTAAILGAAGFETHIFGMQHVSLHPERLGFHHEHPPGQGNATGHIIAAAVEQLLSAAPRDQRLYLEINFEDTHRPYPRVSPLPFRGEGQGEGQNRKLDIPAYLPAGPEAESEVRALQAAIKAMDGAAGRVLAALHKAGRAERALVIFTTDHGLAMPRAKCTLYDPGLEVALLMRSPEGGIGGGVTRPELVSNIDILPTVLEAAGLPLPIQGRGSGRGATEIDSSALPGRSLLHADAPREAIFAEKTFHSYYDPMRCIRTHRHKYIRNFEAGFAVEVPGDIQLSPIFRADPSRYSKDRASVVELYDLEADPLEQHNLAGTAGVKAIEDRLSAELWSWMRETDDPLLKGPVPSPRYRQAMQP